MKERMNEREKERIERGREKVDWTTTRDQDGNEKESSA